MRPKLKRLGLWSLLLMMPMIPGIGRRLRDAGGSALVPAQAPPTPLRCPRLQARGPTHDRLPHPLVPITSEPSGIPRWRLARSDHFIILSAGDFRRSRRLCSLLEAALTRLSGLAGIPPPDTIRVLAFSRPGQLDLYLKGLAPPGTPAAYDRPHRRLLVTLEAPQSVLVHQLSHALLDLGEPWPLPEAALEEAAAALSLQSLLHWKWFERSDRGVRPAAPRGAAYDPAPG